MKLNKNFTWVGITMVVILVGASIGIAQITPKPLLNDRDLRIDINELADIKDWYNLTEVIIETSDYNVTIEDEIYQKRCLKGLINDCSPSYLVTDSTAQRLDDWEENRIKMVAEASTERIYRRDKPDVKVNEGNTTISAKGL